MVPRIYGSDVHPHFHLKMQPERLRYWLYSLTYESTHCYCHVVDGVIHADEEILKCIDEAYNTLLNSNSRSLLKKYLTRDMYDKIKDRVTPNGASLLDVINSGVENVDSNIGIYAPDAESYSIFHELFDPIIDEYHGGFSPSSCHPRLDFGHANSLGDLNSKGDFVVSTRVRCARSIEGYPFNPLLTSEHYAELEEDIARALGSLDEDLSGQYTPINRLSTEEQEDLLERHLLFKQGDRFLQAAGACQYWPDGRGIFLNKDSSLVVWVNEEDHMRIISMQSGGDLGAVYERFTRAVTSLGHILPFSSSQRFGFLTFCPTNLGTAIRASVHIRLPNLGEDRRILEDTADRFNLQVRGTSGEHSEAKDFVFDISNRRRLGLTEIEALQEMYDGVQEIIDMEIQMSEDPEDDMKSLTFANNPAQELQNIYLEHLNLL
ncbi:arginine kinase-like [Oratosquilla oratoria]|uniref:arginine kinase-like n=1 Tax=Oratosquilla oratoria TaxID=337810 RepID=UPI003F77686B